MRRTTASGLRPRRIDRRIALFDVDDLAFLIDDKRGPVGHAVLGHQYAVGRGHFTFGEIAQEGELHVVLGGEFFLGRGVIGTDSKNLGF